MQCHLYFTPITVIYRIQQEKNKKNESNCLVAPISTYGQPTERLFVSLRHFERHVSSS